MNKKAFLLWVLTVGVAAIAVMIGTPAYAADHTQLNGTVTKIQSEVVYAKTPWGVRMIGTARQLGDVHPGDRVTIWLNEDNSVIDVHKEGDPAPKHTVVNGHLIHSTPAKTEIRLWTAEGKKVLPVTPSAVTRVSVVPTGSPVIVELNERGQVIDLRPMTVPGSAQSNKA
jgi:hypothetical protein